MKKIFVTGGAGFLGSAICRQLIERGYAVVAYQRSASPELEEIGVTVKLGSINAVETMREAMTGCDAVIHTAAKAGVWGSKASYETINLEGTRLVAKVARELGIRYFVHTSTPSVVFSGENFRGDDERLPYGRNWLCHYAKSKADAEIEVLALHDQENFRVCALRPHLIWGEGDPHLAPALLKAGRTGRLKIIGTGKNKVDMTHVENGAMAHCLALDALIIGKAGGQAYFISDDKPIELWAWVNELFSENGIPLLEKRISLSTAYRIGVVMEFIWKLLRKQTVPPMTRFVAMELAKDHWFSVEKAKKELGYSPKDFTSDPTKK